jgi:hypothetical protein
MFHYLENSMSFGTSSPHHSSGASSHTLANSNRSTPSSVTNALKENAPLLASNKSPIVVEELDGGLYL